MYALAESAANATEMTLGLPPSNFAELSADAAAAPARLGRVLVLGQRLATRLTARSILEKAGYEVEVSARGSEALTRGSITPDVVLVDLDLKDAADFVAACPPAISLVAMCNEDEGDERVSPRFQSSVEKPFRREQLLGCVERSARR